MGEGGFASVFELISKLTPGERVARKRMLKKKGKVPDDEFRSLKDEGIIHRDIQKIAAFSRYQRQHQFVRLISMWFLDRSIFVQSSINRKASQDKKVQNPHSHASLHISHHSHTATRLRLHATRLRFHTTRLRLLTPRLPRLRSILPDSPDADSMTPPSG